MIKIGSLIPRAPQKFGNCTRRPWNAISNRQSECNDLSARRACAILPPSKLGKVVNGLQIWERSWVRFSNFEGAHLDPNICPGLPWFALVCPGSPWFALVCPGSPWFALVCPGLPWFALVCPGLPWFSLVCPGLPWFALVCSGLLWFALVCSGLLWFALVCSGLLSYTHTRARVPFCGRPRGPKCNGAPTVSPSFCIDFSENSPRKNNRK
jgi:hypothetical protein